MAGARISFGNRIGQRNKAAAQQEQTERQIQDKHTLGTY